MDKRLRRLFDAVWDHDHPLGPWDDLDDRMRAELEWEDSLTADDCLALLDWVEHPLLPPHRPAAQERWLPGLSRSAARHAGRAGHRLGDPRITQRLLALLGLPRCRADALEGLAELDDPAVFEAMLCCLGDREVRDDVCLALAASATPEQVKRLQRLAISAPTAELRQAAAEAVLEWARLSRERVLEPDPAADATRATSDPAWRTDTVVFLARHMNESRDFSAMPILADALQDAGCENPDILAHCRGPGPHVCCCWVVAWLLGSE